MIYFVLSTLLFAAGLIVIYWLHNQYHLDIIVEPVDPPSNAPLISVCIPARNEERNIRACVEAVLAQRYLNFEVIVQDDRSTDSTLEILRSIQNDKLKIMNGSDLPSGWAGKPHALYQAAKSDDEAIGCVSLTPILFSRRKRWLRVMPKPSKPMQTYLR